MIKLASVFSVDEMSFKLNNKVRHGGFLATGIYLFNPFAVFDEAYLLYTNEITLSSSLSSTSLNLTPIKVINSLSCKRAI